MPPFRRGGTGDGFNFVPVEGGVQQSDWRGGRDIFVGDGITYMFHQCRKIVRHRPSFSFVFRPD
jgi:hypothetical protein